MRSSSAAWCRWSCESPRSATAPPCEPPRVSSRLATARLREAGGRGQTHEGPSLLSAAHRISRLYGPAFTRQRWNERQRMRAMAAVHMLACDLLLAQCYAMQDALTASSDLCLWSGVL